MTEDHESLNFHFKYMNEKMIFSEMIVKKPSIEQILNKIYCIVEVLIVLVMLGHRGFYSERD